MSTIEDWRSLGAKDLIGPSAEELPALPGVYMWRRVASPPPGILELRTAFLDWLQKEVQIPFLVAQDRPITPLLTIQSLALGGHTLGGEKLAALEAWCDDRRSRRYLLRLVESALALAPALYVGKADDLKSRIRRHLNGDTELNDRLHSLGLDWNRVSLMYAVVPMPDEGKEDHAKTLEALETVVTTLSLGTLVMKIG